MKNNYDLNNEISNEKSIITTYSPYLFFYLSFLYFEFLIRLFTVPDFFSISLLYIPFIICLPGFLFGFLANRKNLSLQKTYNYILSTLLILYYCAQLVIHHIFGFYLSLSTFSLAGQATSYYKEAFIGIGQSWYKIILVFIPIIIYIVFSIKTKKKEFSPPIKKAKPITITIILLFCSFFSYLFFVFLVSMGDKDTYSPYDLYFNTNNYDASVPVFGAIGSTELDIYRTVFGFKSKDAYQLSVSVKEDVVTDELITDVNVVQTSPSPLPSPVPVYNDNIMNIDFNALNENETNNDMIELNSYFSSLIPTKENEKTGIYEGYNVIYMTCEAFSPYAVDEFLTPTLYKMANESFVFENFYTTGDWYTSTSDGEYMMCNGLIPMSIKNTFANFHTNYFAFALPQVLKPQGYSARAFHNNSGTVYSRNLTHPNLGYDFFSKGDGLELSGWPESDLEMITQSVPMYISDDKFLAYYMTVSGHLNYSFSGNTQSKKHEEKVSEMPYSDSCKAYMACHIELDLAMENLLNQLEEAGVLDHTIIAMVADHYPYGLSDEEISEFLGHPVETTFERYRSTLILYTSGKTDSEIVTKPCEAIDVLPTVLNMLGAKYDSRLITGRDIFADEPGLVIFPSRSYITEEYSFKFRGKEITSFTDREITNEEVASMRKHIDDCFYVSSKIVELDYYRKIGLEDYYTIEEQ